MGNRIRAVADFWSARSAVLRALAAVLGMGAIWWSSAQPGRAMGDAIVISFLHNCGHIVAFGGLFTLVLFALSPVKLWSFRHALIALIVAVCYGITDELHQRFVPGRHCSVSDGITDFAGALFASAVLFGFAVDRPVARRAVLPLAVLALCAAGFATWGPY
ncbi:hypothetical protein LBMAG49_23630 [Planctomycetota bacterium]|nr:hypothetical protein LBMAG49_23630 [Planctomycetota bacterium]